MAVKLAGTRFDVDCRPNPKRQQPNGHALTISNGKLYIYVCTMYIWYISTRYGTSMKHISAHFLETRNFHFDKPSNAHKKTPARLGEDKQTDRVDRKCDKRTEIERWRPTNVQRERGKPTDNVTIDNWQ